MPSQSSRSDPGPELEVAFRQHLPQRLHVLLQRARAQCRGGWDCNVLRTLYDEISLLAGVCGRYGMLETGERLLALESAMAPSVAAGGVPDGDASARIDALLDGLRPHLQRARPNPLLAWGRRSAPATAHDPHPPGEASTARFAAQDAGRDPGAAGGPARKPAPELPLRQCVCIVNDDDPLVSELLLRIDQPGCEVTLVDHVDALIDTLRRAPPDLAIVIADPDTPLEPLATALRAARAQTSRAARLLVLLRETGVELQLRALRAGADRCIVLPASPDEVVNATLELADIDHEGAYRILIVDDDAPQALFAQAILRHAGMETRILGESLPVLAELDRFQPDLLLLDLNMPDCDGFELTALIRERNDYVNTPIVFLSGDQDEERQFAALDAGGDDFLVKPIRPAHLVAAVTNRVRRTRLARARAQRASRRDPTSRLCARPRLLGAVSGHLASSATRVPAAGLLAFAVTDASALAGRLGPAALDRVLADLGTFIAEHAPVDSMIARHGAAGYLVFAPAHDEARLAVLARELLDAARGSRFGAQASAITLACAVCALDATIRDTAQALAALEHALNATHGAREPLAVCSALGRETDGMTQRIAAALATDSFGLAFQPVLSIHGAREPYYQALLRLRTDGHEYAAAELIPAAVRAGLIAAIDAWVIGRCVAILAEHLREGRPVRLSASQTLAGWAEVASRVTDLTDRLARARIPGDTLVLEFRAVEALGHEHTLVRLASELAPTGVRLSLAGVDAGILQSRGFDPLKPDYVKLAPNLDDTGLVAAVAAARARGVIAIAPCVESVAEAERMRAAGVALIQGNYIQPPSRELSDPSQRGET